jgi:uncharacterized protein (UPF0248 family)
MIPIHQLLARIRWDPAFGDARFVLAYLDHTCDELRRVALEETISDPDNPAFFDMVDEDGVTRSIPLHRVREVWRDGVLIWRRGPEEKALKWPD